MREGGSPPPTRDDDAVDGRREDDHREGLRDEEGGYLCPEAQPRRKQGVASRRDAWAETERDEGTPRIAVVDALVAEDRVAERAEERIAPSSEIRSEERGSRRGRGDGPPTSGTPLAYLPCAVVVLGGRR